jgi:hypothetical protein
LGFPEGELELRAEVLQVAVVGLQRFHLRLCADGPEESPMINNSRPSKALTRARVVPALMVSSCRV